MFLGRQNELEVLNNHYKSDAFEFIVMYGRRRVGKTTLISEFMKDKKGIFFVSQEYDDEMGLTVFSEKIYSYFALENMPTFTNWMQAFEFIASNITERTVLVLDEFPYMVNANKSIPSILQNLVDHEFKKSKLFLIICGSSVSFMEKEVLGAKNPLYGRMTAQMKIDPFDFFDSIKFVPNYSSIDKVLTYGTLGGIPQYLQIMNDNIEYEQNITNKVLIKTSSLYEEPINLLKQELREPMVYNSIIETIAKGAGKLNEISTKTKMSSDKCSKYISTLIELRILEKETPVGERISKKSRYKIADNYFKFWYRYVFENVELIEQNNGQLLYDTFINPDQSEYIGRYIFENICAEYLRRNNGTKELPFVFSKIGRWWGTSAVKKAQIEVDIIAVKDDNAIFCECKWKNKKIELDVLDDLIEKSENLKQYKNKHFYLFSKAGFSDELIDASEKKYNIKLITIDDMIRRLAIEH